MRTIHARVGYAILLALCVFFTCGDACWPVPQAGTPAGGFPVSTNVVTETTSGIIVSTGALPGVQVSGNWVSGGTGGTVESFGTAPPYFYTDADGNGFVSNGVVNADWTSTVGWASPGCPAPGSTTLPVYVDPVSGIPWACIVFQDVEDADTSTHYALSGSAPSTITAYADFSTTYGTPGLRVYVGGSTPSLVNAMSASSTVPGSSAVSRSQHSRMARL